MTRMRKVAALWLIGALMLAAPALAQTTGSIGGTVTTPDGEPLPGASVNISSDTGKYYTTFSDGEGAFSVGNLAPGSNYTIEVTMPGMTTVMQDVFLATADDVDITIVLKPINGP